MGLDQLTNGGQVIRLTRYLWILNLRWSCALNLHSIQACSSSKRDNEIKSFVRVLLVCVRLYRVHLFVNTIFAHEISLSLALCLHLAQCSINAATLACTEALGTRMFAFCARSSSHKLSLACELLSPPPKKKISQLYDADQWGARAGATTITIDNEYRARL